MKKLIFVLCLALTGVAHSAEKAPKAPELKAPKASELKAPAPTKVPEAPVPTKVPEAPSELKLKVE